MTTNVPRVDVGSAPLLAALIYTITVIVDPGRFDPNLFFGAVGIIVPFLAGYLPTSLKSVKGVVAAIAVVAITAVAEFFITGSIGEATKNVAIPALANAAFMFLVRPGMSDPELNPPGGTRVSNTYAGPPNAPQAPRRR